MPFQKGHAKHGGRKPGTHNKIADNVRQMLDALGCNPTEGLARLALDENQPGAVRAHCYSQLMKHVHPQLQSVQVTGAAGGPIQVEDVSKSARELLKARLDRIAARLGAGSIPGNG